MGCVTCTRRRHALKTVAQWKWDGEWTWHDADGAVWRKYTYIDEYNVSFYEWEQEHMHGDY